MGILCFFELGFFIFSDLGYEVGTDVFEIELTSPTYSAKNLMIQ